MTAADFVPASTDLRELAEAPRGCRGCELWENATQTVFGAGLPGARLLLVGEQPGDVEDRRGESFVGPAGRLLDKALADAGIDREQAYVTNVVKHFRFTGGGGGKRRIHAKPEALHVDACRPWLAAELAALTPDVLVCLGVTAATALLGRSFRVTKQRGQLLPFDAAVGLEGSGGRAGWIMGTLHPSAILRTPSDKRESAYAEFVADLRAAAKALD